MIRNDYILRLIEAYTQALAFFLTRLKDAGPEEAIETADELLRHHLGVGTHTFLDMTDEDVYALLRLRDETATEEKMTFVAAMLHHEATIYRDMGHEEAAYDRWLQALHLVLHVLKVDPGFDMPAYTPALPQMYENLEDFVLPPLTYLQLIATYVQRGELAAAEAILMDWVDADEQDLEPVLAGIDLYERMLELGDADLRLGGLTRADVEEGLAELQEILEEEEGD